MGKISVVFVTALTCIFLVGQISQTEGTRHIEDTRGYENYASSQDNHSSPSSHQKKKDNNQGLRNMKIDGYAEEDFRVAFNWTSFDTTKGQYRYMTYSLACETGKRFSEWKDIRNFRKWLSMRIEALPYTNVTFQIRDKTTARITGKNSTVTPAKEPEANVTDLQCTHKMCTATVEDKCWKYNGNSVTVQFTLQPSSEKLKNPLVRPLNSKREAKLGLTDLDLLPFTNYTVTAKLANSAGVSTNSSLTKEAVFLTRPKRPGRVSSLAVTHATPSSLHVVWTAPDDNPPKGKLTHYKLLWITPGVSTSTKSQTFNESVTSFNITGLEPDTTYEITVSAKNAKTEGYGEAVSITNTTMEQGATETKAGKEMNSTKTTIHFSWNESQNGSSKPVYYRLTYWNGDERVEQNATDTDITLDGLTPGKKYTLKVQECSEAEGCKKTLKRLEEWTRPEEPRVVEKTEHQPATDTTLTIQLPVLQNPPGTHWVLLKKYSGVFDEGLGQEALGMVRMKRKEELRKEEKSNQTQANGRQRRSANADQNDDSLRIAAKVEVVEGREQQHMVVVGSDWNGGDGLESDTDYVVFIVTETKAGPYSEYLPSKPRVMKTTKRRKEPALLGMIAGLCGAALLFICFFTILAVKLRKKRAFLVKQEEENIHATL